LLETMVLAPIRLARLVVPGMRARGGGRIVNISSIYGRTSTPLTGWYQGGKHAIEGISDALRMEVAKDGIDVVLVEPVTSRPTSGKTCSVTPSFIMDRVMRLTQRL
jgi:short-subunit dehydrogenase